jgi:hypothetical protein
MFSVTCINLLTIEIPTANFDADNLVHIFPPPHSTHAHTFCYSNIILYFTIFYLKIINGRILFVYLFIHLSEPYIAWRLFLTNFILRLFAMYRKKEKTYTKAYEIRRIQNVRISIMHWCNKDDYLRNVANNNNNNNNNNKVKFTLEQPTKAQRGSRRIAVLFL